MAPVTRIFPESGDCLSAILSSLLSGFLPQAPGGYGRLEVIPKLQFNIASTTSSYAGLILLVYPQTLIPGLIIAGLSLFSIECAPPKLEDVDLALSDTSC